MTKTKYLIYLLVLSMTTNFVNASVLMQIDFENMQGDKAIDFTGKHNITINNYATITNNGYNGSYGAEFKLSSQSDGTIFNITPFYWGDTFTTCSKINISAVNLLNINTQYNLQIYNTMYDDASGIELGYYTQNTFYALVQFYNPPSMIPRNWVYNEYQAPNLIADGNLNEICLTFDGDMNSTQGLDVYLNRVELNKTYEEIVATSYAPYNSTITENKFDIARTMTYPQWFFNGTIDDILVCDTNNISQCTIQQESPPITPPQNNNTFYQEQDLPPSIIDGLTKILAGLASVAMLIGMAIALATGLYLIKVIKK